MSFETGTPLRDFDAIAFSISFENDYLHVLQVLRLAGIPLRARDRGPRDPLVILGGAAMFLNPEPLAPFADLVAVGEGEPMVPRMMEALLGATTPRRGLETLQPKDGFYVPSRYEVRYHARRHGGRLRRARRASSRQRGWPGTMGFPQSVVLTPHTEMSMKYMVEISRGCPCMCRFCWAGYNYLPVRGFTRARARGARARGARRPRTRSASSRPRSATTPRSTASSTTSRRWTTRSRWPRCGSTTSRRSSCSSSPTPACRASPSPPSAAPTACGKILNKQFTNAEILDKATWIFENGIQNLKLYYMVGLPFEEHEDVEAIVTLTEQIRERMLAVARGRGRIGRIHPSVNPFVPEAGDALPVAADGGPEGDRPQAPVPAQGLRPHAERGRDLQERAHRRGAVGARARRPARGRRARARGDARARPQARACARRASTPPSISSAARAQDEVLPWDVVDNGVSKAYFWKELERSEQERLSPHCPEVQGCIRCGVCVETPNPFYRLPEKWKGRETLPFYERTGSDSGRLTASLRAVAPDALVGRPLGDVRRPLGVERDALERAPGRRARAGRRPRPASAFSGVSTPAPVHEAVRRRRSGCPSARARRSRESSRAPATERGRPGARSGGRATGVGSAVS